MKEILNILNEYDKLDFSLRKAALATVVRVRGSSYRSPGARMLITDDGRWVGSISGGCLEGDALRKARHVMNTNTSMVITYDTREESNQNLGIGLGCNGVIDVFIEPLTPSSGKDGIISLFQQISNTNRSCSVATIISGEEHVGARVLMNENGETNSFINNTSLTKLIETESAKFFHARKSGFTSIPFEQTALDVFIETFQPNISLIIFGGGFDARPVSALAKTLGWNVTVTDECVAHIAPVFFPSADSLSLCNRTFIDRDFRITPFTACVLMSHNYEYDRDVLKKLLLSNTSYIGILGPRKRFDKMLIEFKNEGIELAPSDFERIHSPIGIDIGAETPDEIALAIISEIQAKFAHRSGGFLKYRQGPIHNRDGKSDDIYTQIFLRQESDSGVSRRAN